MADYFSNIINRSTDYQSDALQPVQFLDQNSKVDFDEIVEENNALLNNFDAINTEKTATGNSIITNDKIFTSNQTSNYFTNSYERNVDENGPSILIKDDLNPDVNFKNEPTGGRIQEKNNFENYSEGFKANPIIDAKISKNYVDITENLKLIENRNIENNLIGTDKIVQSVLLEKQFFLQPNSNKNHPINVLQNPAIHTETIKDMLLPQKQAEIVENTENRNESPRLIIGKINVEILTPTQPTTKVINQIIQSPAPITFPKTNRNIFGLGQL